MVSCPRSPDSNFAARLCFVFFFFNDTATTEIYTLSLHDALPICHSEARIGRRLRGGGNRYHPGARTQPPPRSGDSRLLPRHANATAPGPLSETFRHAKERPHRRGQFSFRERLLSG